MIFALAWSQVRTQPARLLAIVAAVMLATGFLAATATFAGTSGEGLRLTAAAPLTRADIVADAGDQVRDPRWFRAVADVPGVRTTDPQYARTVTVFGGARRGSANVQSIAATPEVRWFRLAEGAWPTGADQVVADQATLTDLGVRVGDTLAFRHGDAAPVTVTVTGSADLGFRPLTGASFRFYADPAFFAGDVAPAALLTVTDPGELNATIEAVGRALPAGATATSAAEAADRAAARFAGGNTQLVILMLSFAAVALLASVLVIANTFHVVIAQRTRQIALLRLVGGHRAQVRRVVLAEAAVAGTTGAIAGAAAGVGLGYLGARLLDIAGGGLRVNPIALVLCVLAGVAATLVAAWAPARRATRIAPVRALQEAGAESTGDAARGGVRLVAGLIVTALGAVALTLAGIGASLPLALAGGVVLAAGLLIALPRLIAVLLPAVARLLGRFGVAADLAGGNLSRSARRTATAAMAVVVGAALISCLAVAATSGQATVDADLEERYPVAFGAWADGGKIDEGTAAELAAVPGLSAAATIGTVPAKLPDGGRPTPATLAALPPDLTASLAPELAAPADPPVVLLPASYLTARGLAAGDRVDVAVAGRTIGFTARPSRLADTTGRLLGVVSPAALDAAGARTTPGAVWGVAPAGFDRAALAGRVNAVAAKDPRIEIGGGITEGSDIADVLRILLGLSIGMLGVTALIALLGLANLLGLSVIERTREFALLRALGTRRGRIRAMLAAEAVTITLLGAAAGVVIGAPVGLAAVVATVGTTAEPVVRLPWGQLALLLLAAAVTGVLASLAPARRATRIAPAAGLTR